MKKFLIIFLAFSLCFGLFACAPSYPKTQIAATTLPVYEFTVWLCQDTGISVGRVVTEDISCLHNYTLQVNQMRLLENAELVVLSGAGLEDFLGDALRGKNTVDASQGIDLHRSHKTHGHESQDSDPHIWLSPANARKMAENIYNNLTAAYPEHADNLYNNFVSLNNTFDALETYAETQLSGISCRELITFHDGFSYMAEAYDLTILHAIEEESGSEASAAELIYLIALVENHSISSLFVERNGSDAAAKIISAQTGMPVHALDMALSGDSYFTAMYHNIDTLKEALK